MTAEPAISAAFARLRRKLKKLARRVDELEAENAALRAEAARLRAPDLRPAETRRDKDGHTTVVNEYRVVESIGHGSFASVQLCEHALTGQRVAIKTFHRSLSKRLRLAPPGSGKTARPERQRHPDVIREIAIHKKLSHPNVVRLYEALDDPTSNQLYMVLEYVDGGHVDVGTSSGDLETILNRFRGALSGLAYLHAHNIIHRDIKPSNILVEAATGTAKICDFGLSQSALIDFGEQELAGTPTFWAPEVARADPGHDGRPADVYALGATLYAMLFHRLPVDPEGLTLAELKDAIVDAHVDFEPEPIPKDVCDLLKSMLEKDKAKRATISDVLKTPVVRRNNIAKTVTPVRVSEDEMSTAIRDVTDRVQRIIRTAEESDPTDAVSSPPVVIRRSESLVFEFEVSRGEGRVP